MLSELQMKAGQGKESPNSPKFLTWNLTTLRCLFYVLVRKRLTEENSKQASQARPAYLCSINPTTQSSVTENYSCQSHPQGGWCGFSLSLASPFFSFYTSHGFSTTPGTVLAELCIDITLFSKSSMCFTNRSGAIHWDQESEDMKVNLCSDTSPLLRKSLDKHSRLDHIWVRPLWLDLNNFGLSCPSLLNPTLARIRMGQFSKKPLHLYIKQIINKDLLCSTGNST